MAIEHGASAIGLVSEMPSGPGPISEDLIATIAATIPPAIGSFLLTCKQDVSLIIDQQKHLGVNTIQICDRLEHGAHRELRAALPGISLVQVIHVTGLESVFLAGGLKSENVAEAIRQVGPFAVDVCSGLRTSGLLDETKLKDFFAGMAAV